METKLSGDSRPNIAPMTSVTVVMPVYNAGPYLDEAVTSILDQSYDDFTFCIYDDCSTDDSYQRLLEWQLKDRRIQLIKGTERLGPVGSSNAAARLALSPFVARMDADDVASPRRLELQLAVLQSHRDAVLVASTFQMIDQNGTVTRGPMSSKIAGRSPPFAHPTIMYRREEFEACGAYREGTDYFEDLDLLHRLSAKGSLLVINRPLLSMRFAGQNARLNDEADKVELAINQQYDEDASGQVRLNPKTFYTLAILRIQAGQRPKILRKVLRKMNFRDTPTALTVILLITAGDIAPHLTRSILRFLALLGDLRRRRRILPNHIYRWQFESLSCDLGKLSDL